ncbi:MAG: hypothetical protein LiPW39_408 [Parcubacteria group bacterium LiPW_39]|nr:MAG: hypothetical protein LiPW39_408 [Parcubacteria group bacterium LiPW_39]
MVEHVSRARLLPSGIVRSPQRGSLTQALLLALALRPAQLAFGQTVPARKSDCSRRQQPRLSVIELQFPRHL